MTTFFCILSRSLFTIIQSFDAVICELLTASLIELQNKSVNVFILSTFSVTFLESDRASQLYIVTSISNRDLSEGLWILSI